MASYLNWRCHYLSSLVKGYYFPCNFQHHIAGADLSWTYQDNRSVHHSDTNPYHEKIFIKVEEYLKSHGKPFILSFNKKTAPLHWIWVNYPNINQFLPSLVHLPRVYENNFFKLFSMLWGSLQLFPTNVSNSRHLLSLPCKVTIM